MLPLRQISLFLSTSPNLKPKSWALGQVQVTLNWLSSTVLFPENTADDLTPLGVPHRLRSLYNEWKMILTILGPVRQKISQIEREHEHVCVCFSRFSSFCLNAGFLLHNAWRMLHFMVPSNSDHKDGWEMGKLLGHHSTKKIWPSETACLNIQQRAAAHSIHTLWLCRE